jgi:hypothetical protein
MSDADYATTIEQLEAIAVKPSDALEDYDRITARLDFYYEKFNENPIYSSHVLEAVLPQSEEDVYKRKVKVDQDWIAIDTGWLENVSYILIKNTKKAYSVHPSKEEQDSDKNKNILVRYDKGDPLFTIDKGSFLLFKPMDVTKIQISSPEGSTKVELIVMPLG